jgi:hypothetical protein
MQHRDERGQHPKTLMRSLAIAAVTGATAVSLAFPGGMAFADPVPTPPPPAPGLPVPPPPPPAPGLPVPPADPNAPPPDPNAPPPDPNAPPLDPNAPPGAVAPVPPPEPGRVDNASGGFSYVVPAGWKVSDNTNLSYGQALLTRIPAPGTEQAPTDTSVLLGRLDLKLFAGAETDNAKAATRLASDMGEFFMPFAGTRNDQQAGPLNAAGLPGAFSSYSVKFTDTTKPDGPASSGKRPRREHRAASGPRSAGSWSGSVRPPTPWTRPARRCWLSRSARSRRRLRHHWTRTLLRRRQHRSRRGSGQTLACPSRWRTLRLK